VFEAVPGRGSLGAGDLALKAGVALPTCLALLDQLADQGFLVQNVLGQWQLPPRGQRAR